MFGSKGMTFMTAIVRILCVSVGVLAGSLSPVAAAATDQPGTPAQKRACRPDVYRLCAGEIPNVRAIVSCLKANASRLSPDCRAVFDGGAQ